MMPFLLTPAALAVLVALAVPLAIHLARRSAARATVFAALRWLDPKPRPRSRVRFDEWLLLIARLILLALVALWLAQPLWSGAQSRTPWLAVVPGLDVRRIEPAANARRVWLSPGFPSLDRPRPAGALPVASLLRQLDAEMPAGAALKMVVPAQLDGTDAERPRLSRRITWQVVAGAMPAAMAAPPSIPRLSVRYAPEREASVRYLRAVATAWQGTGHAPEFDAALPSQPLPTQPGTLVWLVPGPLPASVLAWVTHGGTALVDAEATAAPETTTVDWHDEAGAPLVTSALLGRGRLLRLTRALTPSAMPQLLEPDFPQRLKTLLSAPPPAPARTAAAAYAPLTGGRAYRHAATDLRPWLALLIAAVLLGERWLATGRRSTAAA